MEFILLFILLIAFAIYAFSKAKKKPGTFDTKQWHELLTKHVLFYTKLNPTKQQIFQKRMLLFLQEVYVEGVKTELTELDKILVAASAVIPVFGFKEWHYNNLSGVLIYPDTFNEDLEFSANAEGKKILGLVGTGRFEGQMILSKKALRHGFRNKTDKSNTGIHEFVHLIDKTDGFTDGIPERLLENQYAIPWLNLMHEEMEAIHENNSDIRKYGGTNKQEFFAVAAEYFFERPDLLKRKHPALFEMLEACFQTDSYIA